MMGELTITWQATSGEFSLGVKMKVCSHRNRDAGNRSGYSIVELLIVMACVAVISGFLFIRAVNVLPSFKSNAAMDLVIQQVRIARNTAIADRRAVILNVSAAAGTIQLQQIPANGGLPVTISTLPLTGAQFCVVPGIPDTPMGFGNANPVSFVNANNPGAVVAVTEFLSDGSFGGAVGVPVNGTIFMCIPGNNPTPRAVTILGSTGRIRPYRWNGSTWQE
jgi:type II secretory pathway pseudopilin PulG